MKTLLTVVLATLLPLAGAHAASQPPQPPQPDTSTDPDRCTWVWQTGGGIGVWTEKCEFDGTVFQLKYDVDAMGFALFAGEENEGIVLRSLRKDAAQPVDAIVPDLVAKGLITDECVFAPAGEGVLFSVGPAPKTRAFFEVMPTGKRKEAYDATPADEVPEPPCGDYGFDPDGMRFFMTDTTSPGSVVYINLGQDGTFFDPRTVTFE